MDGALLPGCLLEEADGRARWRQRLDLWAGVALAGRAEEMGRVVASIAVGECTPAGIEDTIEGGHKELGAGVGQNAAVARSYDEFRALQLTLEEELDPMPIPRAIAELMQEWAA